MWENPGVKTMTNLVNRKPLTIFLPAKRYFLESVLAALASCAVVE